MMIEAQYLNRVTQSLNDELKEITTKLHDIEEKLRLSEIKSEIPLSLLPFPTLPF